MDIFTHRRKKAHWKKIGQIGGFMRKEDNDVGAAFLAHFRQSSSDVPHICTFFTPLHCEARKKSVIQEKKHYDKKTQIAINLFFCSLFSRTQTQSYWIAHIWQQDAFSN